MIEVRDLHYCHHRNAPFVLRGVTFKAQPGILTAVLGPNGSGKTTLFKCIAGLWQPQRGEIRFQGRVLGKNSLSSRAKIIAVVPQEHEPPFPYSVLDAVMIGRTAHLGVFSTPSRADVAKTREAISLVRIEHLVDRPYTQISGGERQLVLIARALAQESPVMLLDEPTSHLDFKNQILVLQKLKQIVKDKMITALMTLHDPNLALLFADYVIMLNQGQVVATGSPEDVMNEENISKLYGVHVAVVSVIGSKIIIPKLGTT